MKHVEYSQRPAQFSFHPLPHGEVLLSVRENIVPVPSEDGERWTADEYSLTVRSRKNLEKDVTANFGTWLTVAKTEDFDREARAVRAVRDKLLAETDYLFTADYPMYDEEKEPWRVYRQALRDVTKQAGFPYEVEFPEKPRG